METDYQDLYEKIHKCVCELPSMYLFSDKASIKCLLNEQVETLMKMKIFEFPELKKDRLSILANDSPNQLYFYLITILKKHLLIFQMIFIRIRMEKLKRF